MFIMAGWKGYVDARYYKKINVTPTMCHFSQSKQVQY